MEMRRGHRVAVLAAYALYFLAVGLLQLVADTPGAEWILPVLALLMAIRVVPLILYRPWYGWFHPLIFGPVLTFLHLLRSFPNFAFGLQFHVALPGYSPTELSQLLAFELVLSSIGLLAYYAGFFWGPFPRVPRLRFRPARALPLKVAITVLLSAAIFAVWLEQQGGLVRHIISWGLSRHVSLAGEFYWLTLPTAGVFACLLWLASEPKVLRSPLFWFLGTVSLAMTFLTAGSRSAIVFAVGVGLLVWMLQTRRLPVFRAVVLAWVALLALAVLGEFRRSTFQGEADWSTLTEFEAQQAVTDFVTGEMHSRATSAKGSLPILARVPSDIDHIYGSSYLALVTLPVPRKLWEGKPGLLGGRVSQTFYGWTNNAIPAGSVAEAYWNFSIPGVLIIFFLFGIFHRWLVRTYVAYAGAPVMVVVYIFTLARFNPGSDAIVGYLLSVAPVLALGVAFGMLGLDGFGVRGRRSPYLPRS